MHAEKWRAADARHWTARTENQMTLWTEMPEFDGVDLTESYVLGWRLDDQGLSFDLDVALAPDHTAYRPPRPDERTWRQASATMAT